MRALIIVDVQNDFCPGGSLATARGTEVARLIANYLTSELAESNDYAAVVATQDWHIDPGEHFSEQPDYVDSWPVHCAAGSPGAEFHPELAPALQHVQAVFRKGEHAAAYSGFEGSADEDGVTVGLAGWLRDRGITEVDVCGIATDHCVRATALDAATEGFATTVVTDLCAGVAAESTTRALAEMSGAGVRLVRRDQN